MSILNPLGNIPDSVKEVSDSGVKLEAQIQSLLASLQVLLDGLSSGDKRLVISIERKAP